MSEFVVCGCLVVGCVVGWVRKFLDTYCSFERVRFCLLLLLLLLFVFGEYALLVSYVLG